INDVSSGQPQYIIQGHVGWVLDVAWSPDGKRLATAGHDGTVRIWPIEHWDREGKTDGSRALLFSRAGNVSFTLEATSPDEKRQARYDPAQGEVVVIERGGSRV